MKFLSGELTPSSEQTSQFFKRKDLDSYENQELGELQNNQWGSLVLMVILALIPIFGDIPQKIAASPEFFPKATQSIYIIVNDPKLIEKSYPFLFENKEKIKICVAYSSEFDFTPYPWVTSQRVSSGKITAQGVLIDGTTWVGLK